MQTRCIERKIGKKKQTNGVGHINDMRVMCSERRYRQVEGQQAKVAQKSPRYGRSPQKDYESNAPHSGLLPAVMENKNKKG